MRSSFLGQEIKDPGLSLQWLMLLLWHGFNPWLRNCHMLWAWPKKPKPPEWNRMPSLCQTISLDQWYPIEIKCEPQVQIICNFKFPSSHIKRLKNWMTKINFNDIFYLIQYIQNIIIAKYKIELFDTLIFYKSHVFCILFFMLNIQSPEHSLYFLQILFWTNHISSAPIATCGYWLLYWIVRLERTSSIPKLHETFQQHFQGCVDSYSC